MAGVIYAKTRLMNRTTVYGLIIEPAWGIVELFATHPQASGISTAKMGAAHIVPKPVRITRQAMVAAFMNRAIDELEEEDPELSFIDLIRKYVDEQELDPDHYVKDLQDASEMDLWVEAASKGA